VIKNKKALRSLERAGLPDFVGGAGGGGVLRRELYLSIYDR